MHVLHEKMRMCMLCIPPNPMTAPEAVVFVDGKGAVLPNFDLNWGRLYRRLCLYNLKVQGGTVLLPPFPPHAKCTSFGDKQGHCDPSFQVYGECTQVLCCRSVPLI